jgi:hypothetical protein
MKKILYLIFLFNTFLSSANEGVKVILLIEDNDQKQEEFDKLSKIIYFDNTYKLDKFEIIHLSRTNKTTRSIFHKKKEAIYKSSLMECSTNSISKIGSIVDLNKTEISKFYFCEENPLKIDFIKYGVETILLNDKQYSTISEIIADEIKKNKKDLTLFFYLPSKKKVDNEFVNFENDSLKIEEGSTVKLKTIYSKGIISFQWIPNNQLDCSTCPNPIFTAKNSMSYIVIGKDSLGCEIKSKPLNIIVDRNCKDGFGCIELIFDRVVSKKFRFVNDYGDELYDWQVISNGSGSYQFDVITSTNCADRYKIQIEDLKGNIIWEKDYLREDVDIRSKNKYHQEYPQYYVFRLLLTKIESYIIRNPVKIKILSFDEKGNKYEFCASKRIKFTSCN